MNVVRAASIFHSGTCTVREGNCNSDLLTGLHKFYSKRLSILSSNIVS